jgi:hypothetical protein
MLRELGAFFLLFSFLSLVLHMSGMMLLLGTAALVVFAIDLLPPRFASRFRSSKLRETPGSIKN